VNNKGYSLLKVFEELGLSKTTAYRWVRLGKVRVSRFTGSRGRIRVSEEEFERLRRIASGRTGSS